LLDAIADPHDLRQLERKALPRLAAELRQLLLESVAHTGGHLSSNLGTVELTIALHYVFNTPYDRLVWDVGHQTYPHKILTGRREAMGERGCRALAALCSSVCRVREATFRCSSLGCPTASPPRATLPCCSRSVVWTRTACCGPYASSMMLEQGTFLG